ncbi:hypothetical protein AWW66_24735 [Micromonospora rosaria]|uniref:Uncharacterized protein n=1 Tax=Micromonospora rosaria TaxID=47874 RepID=A0A136PLV3_9ACTN|nr:hypothetical protein [Micromonospora rosaria]KXK59353.1 hypothetical protein AWW66_24735 [Micromonospora rosaria]
MTSTREVMVVWDAGDPSDWSVRRFGPTLAGALRRQVPAALHRAVELARGAREASELDTDHAFGPVRWKQQYEALHEYLRELPDVTDVHPPGAQVRVTICRDNLLLPWRYAKRGDVDMRDVRPGRDLSRLIRDLLILFGPAPRHEEPMLPMMPPTPGESRDREPLREAVAQLAAEPQVILIGFACTSEAGLLRASWGEAALVRDSELEWGPVEDLPLPGGTVR